MKTPGYTDLRRFPKESLIQAILEMKKTNSSEAIRLKEIDLEIQRMSYNLEMKKVEAEVSKNMLQYSNYSDNRYGPMAASNISAAVSNIMGVPMPMSEEVKEATELEKRVEVALSQGMRWNSQNKRPEMNSTVIKKVEAWEKSLKAGREAEPDEYSTLSYQEIVSSSGKSEAFVLGLCETMEKRLGIKESSKYLKTRFKRDIDKIYRKTIKDKPAPTYEQQATGLIDKFWQNSMNEEDYAEVKKNLTSRIEKVGGVQNITVRNLKGLCTVDRLPTAIEFPSDMRDSDKHRGLCWSEKYDDRVQEVIDDYVKEIGL
jgi:hypothetical protein